MEKGEFLHMTEQSLQTLNHQKKEELWASRIQQCRESGLGVQAWCAEQGLSYHTCYKWQQKLYHKYASAEVGSFYEVPLSTAGSAAVTIQIGQYSMEIYNGADERTISSVLRALKTC